MTARPDLVNLSPKKPPARIRETAESTSIPVLKRIWYRYHGLGVSHGRLTAATDTDYMVFTCPGCGESMAGGCGISLKGVSNPFETLADECTRAGKLRVLAFLFQCRCGFSSHFKIGLDQTGEVYASAKRPR